MVSFHACLPSGDLSGSLSDSVKIVPRVKSDPDVSVFVRLRFIIASGETKKKKQRRRRLARSDCDRFVHISLRKPSIQRKEI